MDAYFEQTKTILALAKSLLNEEQLAKCNKMADEIWTKVHEVVNREDLEFPEIMATVMLCQTSLIDILNEEMKKGE